MDAVLVANEAVHSRIILKNGVLCKLDIAKVYDHVSWNFMVNMLQRMCFGYK